MKTSKPFCYAAWTTAQYQGTNGITPCCEWKGDPFEGSIKEYADSEYLSIFKTAMETHDTDIISKNCIECIETESLGENSTRNYINRYVESGRYTVGQLGKLDYRPDNLCNLKCRMCGPGSSSLIEEEYLQPKVQEKATKLHFNTGINSPLQIRDTGDILDFDLSNLKEIAILGGEPTVNKKVFPILDYLIKNNMNETTKLNYTTNCTSINRPWMSRAEQFKEIHVNLSIDAAGKAFPTDTINMTPMYGVAGKLDCIPDHIKADKIKYLEKLNHPTADLAIKHFKRYPYNVKQAILFKKRTTFLDKIRGTSIYDLDPIFKQIII